MPKMKTHSGAKKRFAVTATGKVRGRHAFTSHMLGKKSPKRKRALGRAAAISGDDVPRVRRMLAGAAKGAHRAGTPGPRAAPGSEASAGSRGDS
jgi:large subunit ribosomal protein L35